MSMGPFDRNDRLRWQAASLLAAAPVAAFAATDPAQEASMEAATPSGRHYVEQLHQRVLAGRSATATLEAWCAEYGLADKARVRAVRVQGVQRDAPDDVRRALQVDAGTPLRYRRVQLACGQRVLSEADNWYVPALLTPAMNSVLDGSDEPFGRVVAPLGFKRQTLRDQTYWPARGEGAGATVLEIRALLHDSAQRPFSYVIESYLQGALPH
jgi:chorismate-pyruvate lyase